MGKDKQMNILLTGYRGFIGSRLKQRLDQKYNLCCIDLEDGRDLYDCPLDITPDIVIHLAGKSGVRESVNDPNAYWRNNVEVTRRILEHFSTTRVLYASSSSAYEPELNPYAMSKHICDELARTHSNAVGMRFHTVYSETPRENMFMHKLLNGTLEYVTKHRRDFVHIEDVCDAVEILMHSEVTGILDVGTGVAVPVQHLAPNVPIRLNTEHERIYTQARIEKIQSLGFEPKYDVKKFLTNQGITNII